MKGKLNCILLIDDDEPTNFLNKMVIEGSNCTTRIKTVQSAVEALNFLKSKENEAYPCPDLIFLDINMPRMNGWEFLEAYKNLNEKQRGKVVVILTTSPNPDDEKKAQTIPEVNGFRNKPLTSKILEDIIQKHFSGATVDR